MGCEGRRDRYRSGGGVMGWRGVDIYEAMKT